jgi:hypothetical protein
VNGSVLVTVLVVIFLILAILYLVGVRVSVG